MAKVSANTIKGIPMLGDPYAFPWFGNVGSILMATLNLPRFLAGLLVWLCSTSVGPNALGVPQVETFY